MFLLNFTVWLLPSLSKSAKDLRETLEEFLLAQKYTVETASNYRAAIDKITIYDYDCILLDIMLPDGSGLDILSKLKTLNKSENVIIISATFELVESSPLNKKQQDD